MLSNRSLGRQERKKGLTYNAYSVTLALHTEEARMAHLMRRNIELAQLKWLDLDDQQLDALRCLSQLYKFRLSLGDLILLDGNWYVTHSGLIGLAARTRCRGINCPAVAAGSSRMETLVPQMYLLWCAAPKCGLPKPVLSIAPSGRLTA